MAADKKSNPAQIAQAVLDEDNQAIKVTVVGSGGGTGTDVNLIQVNGTTVSTGAGLVTTGTQRVVLASNQPTIPVDIQDTEIAISMDKDEDSVTIFAPNNNTTPIPVNVESLPDPLNTIGQGAAATALRVHLSDETISALGSPTVNIGSVDVTSVPAPLNVTGPGVASAALRVQLADESLAALENINVTVTNTALEITNDAGNPIPVSGTVNANTGLLQPLTDAQLRASAVPVSATALPLPSGASTEAKQDSQITELQAIKGHVDQVETKLDALLKPADTLAAVTTVGSITNTVTVQATDLDVRNLTFASDKVDVTGSDVTVSATDLDIRNLTATDVVTVTGGAGQTADVKVTLDGEVIELPNGAATLAEQQTQSTELVAIKNAIDSLEISVNAPKDILGVGVSGTRNNQVEISFDSAPGVSLVTETFAGGGSVSITAGHSIYRTGTAATASAQVVTIQKVVYRPAHEIYAYFTAAFTTGVANSYQRIGLFDSNNGFFIGFEGATFGITKRTSTVDTFTARTAFSDDLLNGNPASRFTRNGVPEAINLGFSNLFRVRFAWLGSASVIFEVFTPDGDWIPFHTLKVPNSQYNPSIANPDLPISLQVAKTAADATDISIATACWAGGTTSDHVKISDILTQNTLATLTRSVITGETTAGGGGFVNVKVNPSGALNVAATQDGTWNINNITGTVTLPTGASTIAAQNTGNASLSSIDGKLNSLGQKDMAGSVPVVIASNQTAVPASQSGTWSINNISGTVSLPTGASTEAKQDSQITELQAIKGHVDQVEAKLDTLITQTDNVEGSLSSIDTKVSTAANQVSTNTKLDTLITQTDGVEGSLTSIDGKLNSLGQKTMLASMPVVIASDQTPVSVDIIDGYKPTYTAGLTNYVGYTNTTDILTIRGSSTKTIRIWKIHISAVFIGNTARLFDVYVIRRSSPNTGGTPTIITPVKHDTNNPDPTVEVTRFGSAPTLGTQVGILNQSMLFASATTSAANTPLQGANFVQMTFGDNPRCQPLTLRGVNEYIAINFNGITMDANLELDIEWTEE